LSYAMQATFQLEEARAVLREAIERNPEDALAWARLAELEQMFGELGASRDAAEQAVALAPELARTQMVLGFAALTRIDIDEAEAAFEQAIALDSANPLPRLGLGLAKIRQSDLADGRHEIEIAAGLDPNDALIRSYLGKAYFEERRDPQAGEQYAIAKQLDPNDPTPWFYDAIRLQLDNRPVEALRSLEKSIALNDNRAPFRSRLLLDEDLATRGVSLARIYDDLGFDQVALVEATNSLSQDHANWSAHRFLSDAYARLPRHEIARVSELLQSQLLQPININPVQPSLTVSDLNIVAGTGPAEASFNEFTPLFARNQVQLTASGVVGNGEGNEETFGDEIVASALWDRYSFSAGQFHFQTDGFRPNNDLQNDIYDLFAQVAATPRFSLQAEYRLRDTDHGDLNLDFDPRDFSPNERRDINQETGRIGGRFATSPNSDIIASLMHIDRDASFKFEESGIALDSEENERGYQPEIQYLFRADKFNLTTGAGSYKVDVNSHDIFDFGTSACPLASCDIKTDFGRRQNTVYAYSDIHYPDAVTWTIGLNYTTFEDQELDLETDKVHPKFGVQWYPTNRLRLRAGAFKTLKRALAADQTIEPTQIAGFNQFFDDVSGTEVTRYGVGLDARLSDSIYGGIEASRRDLEVPLLDVAAGETVFEGQVEDTYRAYLYWAPLPVLALSAEARFDSFERKDPLNEVGRPDKVDTVSVPLSISYFSEAGWFSRIGGTYFHQSVGRPNLTGVTAESGNDGAFILDAAFGYRLPKRRGIVSVEVGNILDDSFFFQDENIQLIEPQEPRFIPERTFLLRLTLSL
jgi:tetratricopeptide (TPR) repeat protein